MTVANYKKPQISKHNKPSPMIACRRIRTAPAPLPSGRPVPIQPYAHSRGTSPPPSFLCRYGMGFLFLLALAATLATAIWSHLPSHSLLPHP